MNIYLCSTVRNLLFALLAAAGDESVKSRILLICDQQHIDADDFDLSALPAHIKVDFIRRKEIRRRLDSGFYGRIIRLLAALNVRTTPWLRKKLSVTIFSKYLRIEKLDDPAQQHLFLFNDRNRIARLLRLAFSDYEVIEDGLFNYSGSDLNPGEKIYKLLTGSRRRRRYIGDDARCRAVYLLKPFNAPREVQHKARQIDFINPEIITGLCCPFFRYVRDEYDHSGKLHMLATQPIAIGQLSASGFDLVIYRQLLMHLHEKNIRAVLKVHPREDAQRYRDAFPDCQLLDRKVPLELTIFAGRQKCTIFSIYSTAGMGFEQFCQRSTLIRDREAEQMAEIFNAWRQDISLLDQRIEQLLATVN